MQKFVIIDGNAIFHRAFHAFPPFKTSTGEYTNAIFGFMRMLIEIVRKEKPNYIAVAFDHKDKTFRHVEYDGYKAHRSAPPPELYPQMPRLREVLETFLIKNYDLPGYEADDLIGTFATKAQQIPDLLTVIVTGDKDAFQLVNEKVHVVTPIKGISEVVEYDEAMVEQKMGLKPSQIVDFKALKGDPSDNIKGVQGVGDKTAVELLKKYGTLENIYEHLDELTPGMRKKFDEGREDAKFSKRLATIMCEAPIEMHLDECVFRKPSYEAIKAQLEKLEFRSLLAQILKSSEFIDPATIPAPQPKPVEPEAPQQQSLF